MTKRKLLSINFPRLIIESQLAGDAMKALYLYVQENLNEKEISERLNVPLYRVRQHLGKASFLAQRMSNKELDKAP